MIEASVGLRAGGDHPPIDMPTERACPFDPPRELGELRQSRPLCRLRFPDGHLGWLVTSHALARSVLLDSRFGAYRRAVVGDPAAFLERGRVIDMFGTIFLAMDPPEHTRYRALLARRFTARRVEEYRSGVERIVAERLDAMQQAGPPVDLMKAFVAPVIMAAQCVMVGVPESDGNRLAAILSGFRMSSSDDLQLALAEFGDYLRTVVEARRRDPRDDLISHITHNRDVSDDEIIGLVYFMFFAGLPTMHEALGLSAFALLSHPTQLKALRADPSAISNAVDELLRYATNFAVTGTRIAVEDVELDGITIRKGECVSVSLAAANRDPARFDDPDSLDVKRSAKRQLGFGQGIHVCLGQHLARLELRVALGGLIERFPTLRLAVPVEHVPINAGARIAHTVRELPVDW